MKKKIKPAQVRMLESIGRGADLEIALLKKRARGGAMQSHNTRRNRTRSAKNRRAIAEAEKG